MPCNSGLGMTSHGLGLGENIDYSARRENDRMARVLCDIFRTLESQSIDASAFGRDAADWWREHKAHDELRAKKDREAARLALLRDNARAKLTAEELSALGMISNPKPR